jgi:hypothetical protein
MATDAAMSTTLRWGLVGLSNQTSLVRSVRASQRTSGLVSMSTYRVSTPFGRWTRSRYLNVPP